MGLNVYLYKRKNPALSFEEFRAASKERDALTERLYEEFEGIGDWDAKNAAIEARIAEQRPELDQNSAEEKVEIDSTKYPEHYFKIGYMRSSYNDSGTNSWLRNNYGTDLYDLFGAPGDAYAVEIDWEATRDRLKEFIAGMGATKETFHIMSVINFAKTNTFRSDPKMAMDAFKEQLKSKHKGCYSCKDGLFSIDEPLKVRAVVPDGGMVYLIVDTPDAGDEWYTQAVEIALEMVEWVLAQPDKELYYMHWSG